MSRLHYTEWLRPHRWRVAASVAAGVGIVMAGIGLMSSSGYLLTRAAARPPILDLMLVIVAVRFFAFSRAAVRYLERVVSHDVTFRILLEIRVALYGAIAPLVPARLGGRHTGDLLRRVIDDVESLQNAFLRVTAPIAVAVITSALAIGALSCVDIRLAATLLFFLLLAGIAVPALVGRLGRGIGRRRSTMETHRHSALVDTWQGLVDVLMMDRLSAFRNRVRRLEGAVEAQRLAQARVEALSDSLHTWLTHVGTWVVLLLSISSVFSGELSGPLMVAVVFGVMSSFEAVQPLGNALLATDSVQASRTRIEELGDIDPFVRDPRTVEASPAGAPGLRFRDVHFSYDGRHDVLRGVSLNVLPGQSIAVVGPSGSGKTTLANLAVRFWDPDSGSVELNGKDLRVIPLEEVRAGFSVVSQHVHLFTGTLGDNLRIASTDASDADLMAAVEQSRLSELVSGLPDGLDTFVGEAGLTLSGGERRRVAIARAILKDAPLLILDEATAGLDALTAREIRQSLQQLVTRRACLDITHDLVGMERHTEIIVMRNGRIIERGTHRQLIEQNGEYARMHRLQRNRFAE